MLPMDDLARQAFADWTQAQPVVSAYVHAIVLDRAERDDVLQDVALAVLESYPAYDRSRPFLPWAMGIARHAIGDSLRRRRRRPVSIAPEAVEALAGAFADVGQQERAALAHLADCVAKLEGRAREACDLRYRLDLKPARIAELMGLQPNTASKLLQRVREELRACVEQRVRAEGNA